MGDQPTWHSQTIEQLSQIFDQDPDVKALILIGSLADAEVQADAWSDVDAKIILADHVIDRYYASTSWLAVLGHVIGVEKNENHLTKTVRVCLDRFRRFDLTFIDESALQDSSSWDHNPIPPPYRVIWSRLPDLETCVAAFPSAPPYQAMPPAEIERMVDAFWFKATVAIGKVVRNDLLIGLHLALGLAQDCLVLQMIRRDQVKKTTFHRMGGWGNEIADRFVLLNQQEAGAEILAFIQLNCEAFDDLVSEVLPNYNKRGWLLYPSIEAARQTLDWTIAVQSKLRREK